MAEIGDRLNVVNVLEGSVRTSGSRLKFTVQLVRAHDGTLIWSETYDRELKDIFEIQENVAAAVVDALKLRLLAGNTGLRIGVRRTSRLTPSTCWESSIGMDSLSIGNNMRRPRSSAP